MKLDPWKIESYKAEISRLQRLLRDQDERLSDEERKIAQTTLDSLANELNEYLENGQ